MLCVWSARKVKVSASPTETPQVSDTAAGPHRNPTDETAHSPDCSPRAASRLVTGLSRASCRDASGLAVLMSTGRRAGLPGLSRPAALRPGGQARAHHRPGPLDRHLLPLPGPLSQPGGWPARARRLIRVAGRIAARQARRDSQLQRWAAGYREHRGVGSARAPVMPAGMDGRPADGHRAAWSDARPVPGAAANAPE
jgi:hypothetical protein